MRKFRSHINIRLLTLLAFALWVPMCMLGVFLGLTSHSVSATDSSSSQVNVDLVNGIAIRILNSTATSEIENLNLSIDPVPGGVFTSGNFNVEVSTSNKTGYKLYMNSGTSSTALVNQIDSSFTIPSISSATTSSSFTPNTWGYSLDSTNYNPIPANGDPDQVRYTATSSASDLTPVTVGMNVDMSKASGIYSNQLTFTAVAEPVPTDYALYFEPGATGVSNLPPTMTYSGVASSHTFTIPPASSYTPTRAGYSFVGYLDESTSTTYQPGDTITIQGDIDYTGSATLTAQWALCQANHICFKSNEPSGSVSGTSPDQNIVYMTSSTVANTVDTTALSSSTTQLTLYPSNWTLSGYGFKGWNTTADGSGTPYGPNETINLTSTQQTELGTSGIMLYAQWVASAGSMDTFSCSSLTNIGDVTARTYNGDTYAIAKLADGKCWMIENLRYDVNSPDDGAGTKTTTFSTSEYDLRQYNVTNIDGSDGAYPINLTSPAGASSTTNQYQWKSYGGYYSWASAIGDSSAHNTQYMNPDSATESRKGICPSGWRLPRSYAGSATNNPESDFRNLNNELNGSWATVYTAAASNEWRKYPNNFVFAGYWFSSSSNDRGTYGDYWSSTVYGSLSAYYLSFSSTSVNPANTIGKNRGFSVRCVADS